MKKYILKMTKQLRCQNIIFLQIKELIEILVYDIFLLNNKKEEINYNNKNFQSNIHTWNSDLNNIYKNYHEFKFQGKNIKAYLLKINNNKFILKSGSEISSDIKPSMSKHAKKDRKKYENYIVNWRLIKDIEFRYSSRAASFVCGTSASGNEKWKNEIGQSPKDIKI